MKYERIRLGLTSVTCPSLRPMEQWMDILMVDICRYLLSQNTMDSIHCVDAYPRGREGGKLETQI